EECDALVAVGDALAQQVLAGYPDVRRAALQVLGDLGGGDVVDLDAAQARDLALVAAGGVGLLHLEPGARQHGGTLLHQPAFGGQRQDEARAHWPPPHSAADRRSVWMHAPTAGTGRGAPMSASRPS